MTPLPAAEVYEHDDVMLDVEVDPETGEIISQQQIGPEHLERAAYTVGKLEDEIEKRKNAVDDHIAFLKGTFIQYEESRRRRIGYIQQAVKDGMAAVGSSSEQTSYGMFCLRKGRPKLDKAGFDALSDEEKSKLAAEYPDLIPVKTTIAPDSAAILKLLKAGETLTGFTMTTTEDSFYLKR